MMKNLTKINAIILILAIFIGIIPMGVMADTEGYYSYDIIDSTAIITGYTGDEVSIIIPSELGGYPVTGIGFEAFAYCESLERIAIPDSVINIDDWAFLFCTSLESIIIPDSVTSIDRGAFTYCESLESITIPNSVKSIGAWAFSYCTILKSITIPDSVTSIADNVFACCENLESIIMLDSVKSIGDYAFAWCTSLESINIPDSVTSISDGVFSNCTILESITIPNGVKSIGDYAFSYCESLKNITIPNSVVSIGDGVFSYCTNLESINIPNSVASIGDYAFSYCESLESVTIPNSITSIGDGVFRSCLSLKSIIIPDSVTSISFMAFYYRSNDLVIHCYENSYAHNYAIENYINVAFLPVETQTDENTGITIISAEGIVDEDAVLVVEEVIRGGNFELASELFKDNDFTLFDITLMKDNEAVQPNGKVTVSIPVPEGYDSRKCKVYRIENGEKVDAKAVLRDECLVFKTEHFSLYAVVTEKKITPEILYGDVNGDGGINIQDAIAIFRHLADKDIIPDYSEQFIRADVNNDEEITIQDAIIIFKYLADKITFEQLQAMHS